MWPVGEGSPGQVQHADCLNTEVCVCVEYTEVCLYVWNTQKCVCVREYTEVCACVCEYTELCVYNYQNKNAVQRRTLLNFICESQ